MHIGKSFANQETNNLNRSQIEKMFLAISYLNLIIHNKDYIMNSVNNRTP